LLHAAQQIPGGLSLAAQQTAQCVVKIGDARREVSQVSVQETEIAFCLETQVQLKPEVFGLQHRGLGYVEQRLETTQETLEKFEDDVVLAAEMVVQIARADVRLIRNVIGGDVRFTIGSAG
jgi:hypothetical protein